MKNKIHPFLLCALILCSYSAQAQFLAPTNPPPVVQLAWDQDADIAVTNYFIYEGTNSGQYTVKTPAGTNLTLTITNLTRGVEYFFNVTAQADGLESGFGGEINYTPLAPPPPTPMKNPVVLTVQNTPALSAPWTTIQTVSLAANQASGFFRLKISQ